MSITDELRKYAREYKLTLNRSLEIADRIDAEHEAQLNDAFETRNSDENLESDGWARLPVDADGEVIHVGDVMEERSGHTFEVASLMAFGGSDNWLVLSDPRNFSSFREPHDIRHHHVPTVEDVLEEFACDFDAWRNYSGPVDEAPSNPVAEYAAKLRLAGDAE